MNVTLLVLYGKTTKRKAVPRLPAVLGRSREANITVAHPLVSRRHCEVFENDGLLMLRDLASLNGTMIHGRRIEQAPLLPGTVFTIGPLTFQVLYEFSGNLESVPEILYREEAEAAAKTGYGNADPTVEQAPRQVASNAWSDESIDKSLSGEMAMPDLMALADAEVEEALPPTMARPSRLAAGKRPAAGQPKGKFVNEPAEVDSSLQSGGHGSDPPWAPEGQESDPLAPHGKPPNASPKKPAEIEDDDAEFGTYLEGLQ
jgi:predicted component of type VI protein secretion system